MEKSKVIFQPSGRRGEVVQGTYIIEAGRLLGVEIESLCGQKRACGKCRIKIEEGYFQKYGLLSSHAHVSSWQEEEGRFITESQKREGYRLGCCAAIQGDVVVFVPDESLAGKQVVSKAPGIIFIEYRPAVRLYYVELKPPTLQEPSDDLERLCNELQRKYRLRDLTIDCLVLRDLPGILRKGNWQVTVSIWMNKEIIRIRPGKRERYYGMAIDIGTTTVAGYLCNLRTMEVVDTQSIVNPQCKYGEDIMSRISYQRRNPHGLQKMSREIRESINTLIQQAVGSTHPTKEGGSTESGPGRSQRQEGLQQDKKHLCLTTEDIEDVTLVGNTVMHHILLQVDPGYLGLPPFPPVVHKGLDIKARDVGLKLNKGSYIYVLPNEAGFVGADNVGVLLAQEPYKSDEVQLIIDIGTNGELVLGNKDRLMCSSCAIGPAFEGGRITFGMRAAPGAIERVRIDLETREVDYKVIGRDTWKSYSKPQDMRAKGICGSGVIEAVAELYRSGVVLQSGAINKDLRSDRLRNNPENNQPEFVIAWAKETSIGRDVVITQEDIRQIQLAKAALYCGCKLMMKRMGVKNPDKVKIAGAFGTYISPEKALIIGLLPDCDITKIYSVGNAAGDGARAALLDTDKRKDAEWLSKNIEYIELTLEKDFKQGFIEAMHFPPIKDAFPYSAISDQ